MADREYIITAPDGNEYEITAPEGVTEQQILDYARRNYQSAPQADRPWYQRAIQTVDDIVNSADSAVNTATFGLGDYAKGAGRMASDYLFGKGNGTIEDYRRAVKREREGFEQKHPVVGLTSGIVGAMANPVNKALGQYTAGGANWLQQAWSGALSGAGGGAAQSFGNAEGGLTDRLYSGAEGGATGAAIGGVIPPAAKLVTNTVGKGGKLAMDLARKAAGGGKQVQGTKAARKLSEALMRDDLTPAQAAQRVTDIGPEAALIDAGPNTRALGHTVNAVPGKGKKALIDFLVKRQEGYRDAGQNLRGGQINRINDTLKKLVPENYYNVKAATEAERKFLGRMYEGAKRGDDLVDTSGLLKQLDDEIYIAKGSIQAGLKKIRRLLHDPKGHPEIEIQSLHQAKMAIDDFMQGPGRGSIGNVAKARIRDYQKQLVEAIESSGEAGKLYRTARLGTAGQWRIDDALEEGSAFMRGGATSKTPTQLKAYMAGLTAEEKAAFKVGAARAIQERLAGFNTRLDATKKVIDIPALEEKIKLAFGDEKTFEKFVKMATSEKEMFKSYAKTLTGSETAERLAALEDAAVDPGRLLSGMQDVVSPGGNKVRGGINVLQGLKDYLINPEPQSEAMAKLLMSRNPNALLGPYKWAARGKAIDQGLIDYMVRGAPAVASQLAGQPDSATDKIIRKYRKK